MKAQNRKNPIPLERKAYRVHRFCDAYDVGRTTVYKEMDAGRLPFVKVGRIRLIPADGAREWLRGRAPSS